MNDHLYVHTLKEYYFPTNPTTIRISCLHGLVTCTKCLNFCKLCYNLPYMWVSDKILLVSHVITSSSMHVSHVITSSSMHVSQTMHQLVDYIIG